MSSQLTPKERDFVLLSAFVYAQHGHFDKASALIDALYTIGEYTSEVMIGRALATFFKREWAATLAGLEELDRMDPIERFGEFKLTERQRMRRYIKARCLFELEGKASAREAVDVYLRQVADA